MRKWIDAASLMEGYSRDVTLTKNYARLEKAIEREREFLGSKDITPEVALSRLEEADPTGKKAFTVNLLGWYLDGSMRYLEDAHKAKEALILYGKFRNRGLTPLKQMSFSELLDLGDELAETKSRTEASKEEEQALYDNKEATLLVNNDEWKVVIPHTKEASIYFGRNTRWCTAGDSYNYFEQYNRQGPLYVILNKKKNERFQFHFESQQFMDEDDDAIDSDDAWGMYNLLLREHLPPEEIAERLELEIKDGKVVEQEFKDMDEVVDSLGSIATQNTWSFAMDAESYGDFSNTSEEIKEALYIVERDRPLLAQAIIQWAKEEHNIELDDLKEVMEHDELNEIEDAIENAARDSAQAHAESEAYQAVRNAVENTHLYTWKDGKWTIIYNAPEWDFPLYIVRDLEEAFFSDSNIPDEENEVRVSVPYYGWGGEWDEPILLEQAEQRLYDAGGHERIFEIMKELAVKAKEEA